VTTALQARSPSTRLPPQRHLRNDSRRRAACRPASRAIQQALICSTVPSPVEIESPAPRAAIALAGDIAKSPPMGRHVPCAGAYPSFYASWSAEPRPRNRRSCGRSPQRHDLGSRAALRMRLCGRASRSPSVTDEHSGWTRLPTLGARANAVGQQRCSESGERCMASARIRLAHSGSCSFASGGTRRVPGLPTRTRRSREPRHGRRAGRSSTRPRGDAARASGRSYRSRGRATTKRSICFFAAEARRASLRTPCSRPPAPVPRGA
jgi:hypothetical protein